MKAEQKKEAKKKLLMTGKEEDKETIDEDAKITIIMDKKYNDTERDKLYTSIAGNKDQITKYNNFKKMGTGQPSEINTYLKFLLSDRKNTQKESPYDNHNKYYSDKSKKIQQFIDSNNLSPTQKAYIKATNSFSSITHAEKNLLEQYISTIKDDNEYDDFLKSINSFVNVNYVDEGKDSFEGWVSKKIKK